MDRDKIKMSILGILPKLTETKMDDLLNLLEEYGVENEKDLDADLLQEKDLLLCLPLVYVRKLRREWSKPGANSALVQSASGAGTSCQEKTNSEFPEENAEIDTSIVKYKELSLYKKLLTDNIITPKEKRQIVHELCAKVSMIYGKKNPGRNVWRTVAKDIVQQFPHHFKEIDLDGDNIASGYASLQKSLENRCENMRRGTKMGMSVVSPVDSESENLKRKNSDKYGCVEWSVPELPEGSTKQSQEEDRLCLSDLYSRGPQEWSITDVLDKMNTTYGTVRAIINSKTDAESVKKLWPFLAVEEVFLSHFKRLTLIDSKQALVNVAEVKALTIMKYFTTCGKRSMDCALIEKQVLNAAIIMETTKPYIMGIINMAAIHFGEDFNTLVKMVEETASVDYEATVCVTTPILVAVGSSPYLSHKFTLFVDGKMFLETSDIISAVCVLFAAFFVFNIHYPSTLAKTLEFIQRSLMKMNPDGSKKKQKGNPRDNTSKKVIDTISKMAEFAKLLDSI